MYMTGKSQAEVFHTRKKRGIFFFRSAVYTVKQKPAQIDFAANRRGKDYDMQTQEAIEKVLDALNDDPAVAKGMETDVEGTLRSLVGNEVSEQDFSNLTKGTTRLFSDKAIAALFLKLLKNKKNRSGLVSLLLKVGGVSLLLKLLGKSKDEKDESILSSLLGNKTGLALLLKLIGKKNDEIPALSILSNVMGGKEDSSGLLGSILGAVLK